MKQSTTVDDESVFSRRWVRYGLIWGIWTIVALFFSTQVFLMYYAEKQPIRYTGLPRTSVRRYPWALATPLVLWLSRRFRIERSKWLRRVGLHSLFQSRSLFSLIAFHFVVYMWLIGRSGNITAFRMLNYVYYNLDRWLLIYWLILVLSHAFNYYQSFRKGELKASAASHATGPVAVEALKMQVNRTFFSTLFIPSRRY